MEISRFPLCVGFLLFITVYDVVQSSSAGFTITAVGQSLDLLDEAGEIPSYHCQMKVGQTVTFVSQGYVAPRGKPNQPSKPDAGEWLFDDHVFQLLPSEKNLFDKTQLPVMLKALTNVAEQTHVRFVGKILGYNRKYDVLVDIVN
ncbi:unnamed protein product [Adineta steineri]|uniref:Uncharacterized protein n=1 Tax=Adineta steineri TaxID=433720 RepID=A0A819L8E0_9BILA|nr:unnamed protein product [Adineta steineri]